MIAFRHKIRQNARMTILWLFFGCMYLLYDVFDEGSNSVNLSEQLANIIKLSEKHWKSGKQSFQNMKGHMESVN